MEDHRSLSDYFIGEEVMKHLNDLTNKKKLQLVLKSILALIVASIFLFFSVEFISNYLVQFNLKALEAPTQNSRVLVFAPHNDDEALGCAEFIKYTLKNGGQVQVVFTTNGDGFKNAIQFDYYKLSPKPTDYIQFGYTRQQESITALETLGVSRDNIIFLGYPDGGISDLWNSNWDANNPYLSAFTKVNKTPYNNSYTKDVSYTGENLVLDFTKILEAYQPTCLVMPHPNDNHPDHYGTNEFVKYTLQTINYKPDQELLYLVHRGDWPTPMTQNTSLYLVPPYKLINTGTTWSALNLDAADIAEKASILKLYNTQTRTLGRLMSAFERQNEMFGEYDDLTLAYNQRSDADIKATSSNLVIIDPIKDTITLEISHSADISQINVERSIEDNLHVFLKVNSNVDEDTTYSFNLVLFNKGTAKRLTIEQLNGRLNAKYISTDSIMTIKDVTSDVNGKVIHLVIPKTVTGNYESIFMNGTTSIGRRLVDVTSGRVLIQ